MSTNKKLGKIAAAAALSLAFAAQAPLASAATATGTLAVSAVVTNLCVIVTTPVLFLNYTLVQNDVAGTIAVTCTLGVASYNIGLGAGNGTGATTSARKMTSLTTATPLNYELYRDSGRTQNWGNNAGVDTLDVTSPALIATYNVYGRIPAGQGTVAVGAYVDSVQVTLNY